MDKQTTIPTQTRRLKRWLIRIAIVIAAFLIYVEVANIHSQHMTYRQKVLKAFYPAWMWFTKLTGKNSTVLTNKTNVKPPQSFYDLSVQLNNGRSFSFDSLRGKKVILVNTASNCGYTNQYSGLQELQNRLKDSLVVIGFPANDFKEQEQGNDAAIEQFCTINFGVTFPLAAKSVVVKKDGQSPVFQWLTDKSKNGWNDQAPVWNFCKYLINEEGVLMDYFPSSISPNAEEVLKALK